MRSEKFFHHSVLLGAVLLALVSCSTEEEQPKKENPYIHTIAESKAVQWPPGREAEVDGLDPYLMRENYMVVLDMSGSMASDNCSGDYDSKASAAKAALGSWINSVDYQANLGLIVFDQRGLHLRVEPGQDNRDIFMQEVNKSIPSGGTPLQSSLKMAHEALARQALYQQGYGTYRLMVITDGAHDDGEDPRAEIEKIAGNAANPIELHTIGFCIDHSALNQPGVTVYRSAGNPEELARGLNSVLAESQDFANVQEFTGNDL